MQTGTNFSESFQTIYEDDPSFLETMVNNYPASPLSLFLLLQHYKSNGDPHYAELAKKASIYFQNPAWLNYQLSGDELMKDIQMDTISENKEVETLTETEDQFQAIATEEYLQPENETENEATFSTENIVEQEAIHEMEQEEKVEFVQGEEIVDFEETFVENETKEEEVIEDSPAKEELPAEEEKIEEDHVAESEVSEPREINSDKEKEEESFLENDTKEEIVIEDTSGQEEVQNEEEKIEEDERIEENVETDPIENDPTKNTPEETIPATNTSVVSEETESSVPTDSGSEESTAGNKEENLPESTNVSSETDLQKEEEIQELEFEPLHTIDYFASQGIIIREEALMDDKLGKQVKSFTDWLKSMKKLHPGKLPEQNEVVERIIQSSAELSNEDAGILTESMAEVLLKQGKKAKAIEMFEKLSLMNPSKSTYFAAKIESLKNK